MKPKEKLKFKLVRYTDAAYEDCVLSRKSTVKYLFYINRSLLTWQNKRQTLVVTSTTEVEYVIACETIKKTV